MTTQDPISPSLPGIVTSSTRPLNATRSGVTISSISSSAIGTPDYSANLFAFSTASSIPPTM